MHYAPIISGILQDVAEDASVKQVIGARGAGNIGVSSPVIARTALSPQQHNPHKPSATLPTVGGQGL